MNGLGTSGAKRSFNLRTGVVSTNNKGKKKNEDSTVSFFCISMHMGY